MTASTTRSRSGSSWAPGTRYGMPASRILPLARTSRCAIVDSGTRKARAISAVVRPPRNRSVRATCAAGASARWPAIAAPPWRMRPALRPRRCRYRRRSGPGPPRRGRTPRERRVRCPPRLRAAGASVLVQERTHLDRQRDGFRRLARPLEGGVEIRRLDHGETADVLLAFDVGAVRGDDVAVLRAHDRGGARVVETGRKHPHAGRLQLVLKRVHFAHDRFEHLGRGRWPVGLIDAEQIELHRSSFSWAPAGCRLLTVYTNGGSLDRQPKSDDCLLKRRLAAPRGLAAGGRRAGSRAGLQGEQEHLVHAGHVVHRELLAQLRREVLVDVLFVLPRQDELTDA